MTHIENEYALLDFFDCYLERLTVGPDTVTVGVRNLGVLAGHALKATDTRIVLPYCQFIFAGVTRSERVVYEYDSDPRTGPFRPAYRVIDGPCSASSPQAPREFGLEGVLTDPWAWVDWTIHAVSCLLTH